MHFSLSQTHTHRGTASSSIRPPPPCCQAPCVCACTRVCLFVCACANVSECRSKTVMQANFITSTSLHKHTQKHTQKIRGCCFSQHTLGSVGQLRTQQANIVPAHKRGSSWPPWLQLAANIHFNDITLHRDHWPNPSTGCPQAISLHSATAHKPAKTGQIKDLICLTLSAPGLYVHSLTSALHSGHDREGFKAQREEDLKS